MGFLDRQSRVLDVVLTERGRRLYASGRLDFAYFGIFDDGIDYDPWSTGTLGDEDRETQIEFTPLLEAPFVPDRAGRVAPLEPTSHIFTAAPGYVTVPTMDSPLDGLEVDLQADQRRDGDVYRRAGTSLTQIDLDVTGDTERGNPGFVIRVFSSGTNGLRTLDLRRDLDGRRAYDPFVAISIDSEDPVDRPRVDRPDTRREQDRFTPRKG